MNNQTKIEIIKAADIADTRPALIITSVKDAGGNSVYAVKNYDNGKVLKKFGKSTSGAEVKRWIDDQYTDGIWVIGMFGEFLRVNYKSYDEDHVREGLYTDETITINYYES